MTTRASAPLEAAGDDGDPRLADADGKARGSALDLARIRIESARSLPAVLILTLSCVLLLTLVRALGYGLVDDAYISLRYASNLATGQGLVFNVGERVEGYTSFTWTLLLALLVRVGAAPELAARLLGLSAGVGLLIASWALHARLARLSETPLRPLSTPLALALSVALVCYAASGLETALFSALLVASAHALIAAMGRPSMIPATALLLAVTCMTRPEGIAAFVYSFFFLAWHWRRNKRSGYARQLLWLGSVFALPCAAHLFWRHAYYGFWLPNTYYAKIGAPSGALLGNGLAYIGWFAVGTLAVVVLPAALALPALRRNLEIRFLCGLTIVMLAAVAIEGGDHLPLFRFGVPVLPFLVILTREVLEELVIVPARRRTSSSAWSLVALGVTILISVGVSLGLGGVRLRHGLTEHRRAQLETALTRDWAELGRTLRRNTAPTDAIAVLPIGAIGFHSERRVIDMLGLTDLHIAHLPVATGTGYTGHEKFDNQYVLARRPKIILASHNLRYDSSIDQRSFEAGLFFEVHKQLVRMPEFQRDYRYQVARAGEQRYYPMYVRRQAP